MDEDLTLGFKELIVDYEEEVYTSSDRLVQWFAWEDDNTENEVRAFLAVTMTPTGRIQVGGKGPFIGITTSKTMPFEPSMQEVVICGSALALGNPELLAGPVSFDKMSGILTKRKFWKKKPTQIRCLGFLKDLKDLVVKHRGDDGLDLYSVVI